MKFVEDKNENLLFSPGEWRTAQQISSFQFLKDFSNTEAKTNRAGPVREAQGFNSRGSLRNAGI